MKSSVRFRLTVPSMLILLLSFNICYAKESGKSNGDADPAQSSETSQSESVDKEEPPASTRFNEQERYNLLLKEYVEAINKAENDDARIRLQRKFDQETREYKNYLAEEKKELEERDIEKEKQALKDRYHEKLNQLELNHAENVRRLKNKCRRDAFGVEPNRPDLEPDNCKEMPSLQQDFNRRLKSLENDYKANLRALQKSQR